MLNREKQEDGLNSKNQIHEIGIWISYWNVPGDRISRDWNPVSPFIVIRNPDFSKSNPDFPIELILGI